MPALLPQQVKGQPAAQGAASRLLTVNPLLVVSLVLALAAVLFQVPHRCHKRTEQHINVLPAIVAYDCCCLFSSWVEMDDHESAVRKFGCG